jgi:hypothetical protein
MNWVMLSRYTLPSTVSSNKMGPTTRRRDRGHHTPSFSGCKDTSRNKCGFSLDQILLFWLFRYPSRWNHETSLKKTVPSKFVSFPSTKARNNLNTASALLCPDLLIRGYYEYDTVAGLISLQPFVHSNMTYARVMSFLRFFPGDCSDRTRIRVAILSTDGCPRRFLSFTLPVERKCPNSREIVL